MRKVVEWIVDHPWAVLGAALAITVGFLLALPGLTTLTDFKEYMSKSDPAVQAMDRAEERYGSQTFFMVAVVAPDTIFKPETLEKIKAMREEFEDLIGVEEAKGPLNSQVITGTEKALIVGPAAPDEEIPRTPKAMEAYKQRVLGSRMLPDYIVSSDGKAAAISIKLTLDADETTVARQVIDIVEKYNQGPEKIYIVGLPYMSLVLNETMGKDLRLMLPLVILVIVIVLYLSFASLRGVLLPLLVVTLSTIWAVGAMALLGVPMTVLSFILPVILMAIGIAYGIHVLNKYYEGLAQGRSKREAVIETTLAMLSPVSMAGLTTVAGFLSLVSSFLIPQKQFGVFTALGVFAAMVLSLALIPALLALLPLPKRRAKLREGTLSRALAAFEWTVVRHRRAVLALALVIFLVGLVGTSLVRVESSEEEFLGKENPVVQASHMMNEHFSGSRQLLVEFDSGRRDGLKDPELLERIVAFQEWLESKPGVQIRKTISLADLVREMNQKFHADDPAYYTIPDDHKLIGQLLLLFTFQGGDLDTMALQDFSAGEVTGLYPSVGSSEIVQLAREVRQYLEEHFPDVRAEMVGQTRVYARFTTQIVRSQAVSLTTSIVTAGLIVALLMGSWVAGLVSLIPLVLTIVINFGLMGLTGTPLDISTLMVASIAIGIGIDYAIHFISRFRREFRESRDPNQALEVTIQTTGRGIAYNALTLALGFGVLLLSGFKGTQDFGLLIALTMIISSLSAFTVIPAVLITWQPKFLTQRAWRRREKGKEVIPSAGELKPIANPNPSVTSSSSTASASQRSEHHEGGRSP
jgi:hypothetical protein